MEFGLAVLDWIAAHLHHTWLDPLMVGVSQLSNNGEIWIAIAVLLMLFRRTRRAGAITALALLFSLLLCNLGLKLLVLRPRPFTVNEVELLVPAPTSYSFPSGHTSASFAAAGGIALLGKPYAVAAYALAVLIGFSRLYLYVHYPGDVLVGLAVGLLAGWLARLTVDRLWPGKNI